MVDQRWDSYVSMFDVNTLIEKFPKFENDVVVMGKSEKLIEKKIMNLEGAHQLEFQWIMYISNFIDVLNGGVPTHLHPQPLFTPS